MSVECGYVWRGIRGCGTKVNLGRHSGVRQQPLTHWASHWEVTDWYSHNWIYLLFAASGKG